MAPQGSPGADDALRRFNFNPDQPRDWHGRWTIDDNDDPRNPMWEPPFEPDPASIPGQTGSEPAPTVGSALPPKLEEPAFDLPPRLFNAGRLEVLSRFCHRWL